jgi:butyryl-CoA:acetate CoA-transferase
MAYEEFLGMYQSKLTTAEEAVKVIKSGDWVDYGFCNTHPHVLDEALARRAPELEDVKVRGGIALWKPAIFDIEEPAKHIIYNSHHTSGFERKHIDTGACFYEPMRYSELPRYYYDHINPPDVAMIQVGPMDKHGYFNFGVSASHMKAICDTAKILIVEVNQNMPRCLGGFGESVHISDVDMIVEGRNDPMGQLLSAVPTEIDKAVAKQVVERIPNGACLQLGIGGMPNAVGMLLCESDLKDMSVHTEMYVEAFVDLSLCGKISGANKSIDHGRQTYSFAAGSQRVYDFLDDNRMCMAAPVSYVNDIRTIAAIDNFMSINNAVDIDLYGQVSSETSGIRHISGAGGQQDFVLGAYLSNGGKSFICLSSTFKKKDGTLASRIRPTLAEGSIVTDTRVNTMYVVTEYGCVNLKGLSSWERAEALISIAHPDFREELIQAAQKQKIWHPNNKR